MYSGETPSLMNLLKVGVSPRCRKSARKPSREIRIVVGANRDVPLDSESAAATFSCLDRLAFVALYAPKSNSRKKSTMEAWRRKRVYGRLPVFCLSFVSLEAELHVQRDLPSSSSSLTAWQPVFSDPTQTSSSRAIEMAGLLLPCHTPVPLPPRLS